MGETIYEGIGGGFGSAISSMPSLPEGSAGTSLTRQLGASTSFLEGRAAAAYLAGSYANAGLSSASAGDDESDNSCGCCQVCACSCAWHAANDAVTQAWGSLVDASDKLGAAASFRFDLIDVGRYVIGGNFSTSWQQYSAAFAQRNTTACAALQTTCLDMIDDYDALLSTDVNFQLGRWQNWSLTWGSDQATMDNLEYNARNQLTLWGPSGQISDYAKKEWGGLVRSYCKPRYELLFRMAEETLQADEMSPETSWNQTAYAEAVLAQVELPWQTNTESFPSEAEADALVVSRAMHAKYRTPSTAAARTLKTDDDLVEKRELAPQLAVEAQSSTRKHRW